LVVPQNGEELLRHSDIRRVVDAAAKEDLWFGIDGAEIPNSQRDVSRTLLYLNRMRADGKPVFVVEYLEDPAKREATRKIAAERGLIITFAPRQLDKPPEVITPMSAASAPPPAAVPAAPEPAPAKPKE
jgi:cysteinyl-tRNA synthetase